MTIETHVAQYEIWREAAETLRATLPNVADSESGETYGEALDDALRHGRYSRDLTLYVLPAGVNLAHDSYAPYNDLAELSLYADELRSLSEMGFLSVETVCHEEASSAYLDDDRTVLAVTVHHAFKLVPVTYKDGGTWAVGETITTVPAGVYVIGQSGNGHVMTTDIIRYVGENADTESLFYAIAEDEDFGASNASAGCSADDTHVWEAEGGSWHFSGEYVGGSAPDFAFDDVDFSRESVTVQRCFESECAHLTDECYTVLGSDREAPEGKFFCPVDGCTGTVSAFVY